MHDRSIPVCSKQEEGVIKHLREVWEMLDCVGSKVFNLTDVVTKDCGRQLPVLNRWLGCVPLHRQMDHPKAVRIITWSRA